MSTQKTSYTAADLMRISSQGQRCELVKGELVEMAPAGGRHGLIASRIDRRVGSFVEQNNLGGVFAAETGFRLARNPDTVRAPDVAFVTRERLPAEDLLVGFPDLVPDLVVEVVSPSDSAGAVQAKLEDWLRSGASLVWVVYPDTRSVAVYRSLDQVSILTPGDSLEGGAVLPGFSCPVSELF
ncbi:MAG TPA: Uma2 family endonuclease [Dehalococcoidia bacterium]|nr:Uma2 family endonuclease [Dehalococcoidia bacterium]